MQKSKKPERPSDTRAKCRGLLLKLIGGALLLASFISQNFLYDRWDSEQKWIADGIEKNSLLYQSVDTNELLYMAMQPTGDAAFDQTIKLIKLRKAAEAYAAAESITLTLAHVTDLARFTELRQGAQQINDYRGYVEYKRSFNEMETPAHITVEKEHKELELDKRLAQYIYLAIYVLGALSLLGGELLIYRSECSRRGKTSVVP